MNRRRFLESSLLTMGSFSLPSGLKGTSPGGKGVDDSPPNNKFRIEYIREEIPHFEIPPYRGDSYEDTVPDTLDIGERAKLGINCLVGITDERADYEIYCVDEFDRNPPAMSHAFGDWCQNVEGMIEGLPLLRIASGSDLMSGVDRVWMEALLKSVGSDGLIYIPFNGRPWSRVGPNYVIPVWRANGTVTDPSDPSVTQVTQPNLWPRSIAAMTICYLRDKNPMWKQTVERMIQGMLALASDEGDYVFFPLGGFEPHAKFPPGAACEQAMPAGHLALDGGNVRVIQGLAQYYRVTGYEPAGTLAGRLTKYIRFHADGYDAEGRFRASALERRDPGGHLTPEELRRQTLGGHFHGHTIGLLSIVEYGAAVGDRELLEWCKSSYEWAKTRGSSLVGFFPEFAIPDYATCEGCEVADMIGIATKLTQTGVGDYWDDIDHWARNQFAEMQLTEWEWIYSAAETMQKKPVTSNGTADHVPERCLGGFAAKARGNEWGTAFGGCCTGNAVRSLYYIWEHILEHEDGRLRVNLLLNRASKWADVYSYIPYEGRVDVRIKQPCDNLLVRAPEWVENNSPQVACKVRDVSRALIWEGRYINLGAGKVGDTVSMTFPIGERTVSEKLGNRVYTLVIKGNTVLSIDPPGKKGALYTRANYQKDQVRWRKVRRFAPEDEILW